MDDLELITWRSLSHAYAHLVQDSQARDVREAREDASEIMLTHEAAIKLESGVRQDRHSGIRKRVDRLVFAPLVHPERNENTMDVHDVQSALPDVYPQAVDSKREIRRCRQVEYRSIPEQGRKNARDGHGVTGTCGALLMMLQQGLTIDSSISLG